MSEKQPLFYTAMTAVLIERVRSSVHALEKEFQCVDNRLLSRGRVSSLCFRLQTYPDHYIYLFQIENMITACGCRIASDRNQIHSHSVHLIH